MKITALGTVDDGILKISNRKQFDQDIKQYEGKRVEMVIQVAKKRRSLNQNAYLWSTVYPCMVHGFKEIGHERIDVEVVHKFCKDRWLDEPEKIVSPHTGEEITLTKTTTNLTTSQMMDYTESIKRFAAEFLGINIPDPTPIFSI